ncbi:MAG: hypothetical protein QG656_2443, partial [Candidatus Hydrogenedentes bacterium]|nr:hypothetical protein [Candidatus Hydrogenedentota bacterium]
MLNALTMLFLTASAAAIDDAPFVQEYHEPYPLPSDAGADDVRAVAVDAHGTVFAAAKAGLYALSKGQGKWRALMSAEDAGPVFDVMADGGGAVWAGAWNGLYRAREDSAEKVDGIDGPVAALCAGANGILAISPDGIWRSEAGTWKREPYPFARSIRAALADPEGGFWVGT